MNASADARASATCSGSSTPITRKYACFQAAPRISRVVKNPAAPEWEQVLSAGAAAMSLVLAAHALGYAANWITEWYAYDRRFLDRLGLAPHERMAGFVHIGRPSKPPEERARPALEDIVTRELEIFERLRGRVAADAPRVQDTARGLAALDVLSALAETASLASIEAPVLAKAR